MSHFTVLVTKTNETSEEAQLERFYEQGEDSDYFMVKEIEIAASDIKDYCEKILQTLTDRTKLEDNTPETQKRYDDLLAKHQQNFDNGDFDSIIEDWDGYEKDEDGNYYTISNPDAKWDWWVVGGRWSGYFKKKPGAEGEIGRPGVMMEQVTDETVADVIKVKDIDWDAMDAEARAERGKFYDKYHEAEEGKKPFIWDKRDIEALENLSRDEYIAQPVSHATFAVLHDDEWYEKGSMGWWGMVSDEKDQKDWDVEFRKLIESLDPEAEVTVVDCHI